LFLLHLLQAPFSQAFGSGGMAQTTLSFRISTQNLRRLERLCETTNRPKSWHLEQALESYLALQSWQVAHIEKSLREIGRGEVIAHEDVAEWLSSWENSAERDPPS
jgi:predicted transcriptional regulator